MGLVLIHNRYAPSADFAARLVLTGFSFPTAFAPAPQERSPQADCHNVFNQPYSLRLVLRVCLPKARGRYQSRSEFQLLVDTDICQPCARSLNKPLTLANIYQPSPLPHAEARLDTGARSL